MYIFIDYLKQKPKSMRKRILRYTAEILHIRLLCMLEVAHMIEVCVLTIEL